MVYSITVFELTIILFSEYHNLYKFGLYRLTALTSMSLMQLHLCTSPFLFKMPLSTGILCVIKEQHFRHLVLSIYNEKYISRNHIINK